ncbi:MAG: hypothetical protein A2542_01035 [Parcubacteria group bacterium RIFOXYD2_FULL_52_8]|nr:MAG: hypothetical protein A2542_01035 [Parcubacteria group bacterium RIFOXYD2_FULL_52_8]
MYVHVQVVAKAREERVVRKKEAYYLIHVREPAQQNRANERIRELIALEFRVALPRVRIINGHHSPSKLLAIADR